MMSRPLASEHPTGPFYRTLPPPTMHEAALTAGVRIEPGTTYGFFTDTTVCIGCKSCEAACKQWNQNPMDDFGFKGTSYDNTGELSATTWRHVAFVETRIDTNGDHRRDRTRWTFMSDVCKHCENAGCMEACPTGAIIRTEFGTVLIQQDVCNGCAYCVPSCPFGVITLAEEQDRKAHKCTLCYDRMKVGMEPACAKACPTDSIQFGPVTELRERARERLRFLHSRGRREAYLYGVPDAPGAAGGVGSLNCFFLLTERPEVYNLPPLPELPSRRAGAGFLTATAAALFWGAVTTAMILAPRREQREGGRQ